jgi:4-hydroxy-tetrahydrodipicolinate synthase
VVSDLIQRTDKLQGVWNIVPTPFHPDEELDLQSLRTLTDFVVGSGVDGMTILGVLGEGAKVSDRERSAIIEVVLAQANGRVPVCVTVSAASAYRSVEYAREARAMGAHSVMLSAPPLARPNDDAVRRNFLRVAEAVPELPVVIQDLPALGVWMSAELIGRMAGEAPNLKVVKLEEEPTAPKVARLLAANKDLRVLGGLGAEMLIEELRAGAVGTMVNPVADELLGERVYRTLADIPEPVEVVLVFRPSEEAVAVARQAVAIKAKALWLQLGIESDEARRIAQAAGMLYVEDRCIGVERALHRVIKSAG